MLCALFLLTLADIDDDPQGQRLIRIAPKMLDNPLNPVVINAEFIAREIVHRNAACADHRAGDGHEFNVRAECRSILR